MKKIISIVLVTLVLISCKKENLIIPPPVFVTNAEVRANLFIGTTMMDGYLVQYDTSFCNCLDGMDARKMLNFSENLGISHYGYRLVVESRNFVATTDTIHQWMNNLRSKYVYKIQVISKGFPNARVTGYINDKFLDTKTDLKMNDTTAIQFVVTSDPLSSDTTRFSLIFRK